MKYVYVISPHYLNAMRKEIKGFTFAMKGYCSAEQGLKYLMDTNVDDILGYALVYHEIPMEIGDIVQFINTINTIETNKPIVICSYERDGISDILQNVDMDNLVPYVVTDLQAMTDVVIKRSIYGAIVKESFLPYEDKVLDEKPPVKYTPTTISYTPILKADCVVLLEELPKAPDFQRASSLDCVLNDYKDNPLVYMLRTMQLCKKYNIEFKQSKAFTLELEKVDIKDKLLYSTMYKLIEEGRL